MVDEVVRGFGEWSMKWLENIAIILLVVLLYKYAWLGKLLGCKFFGSMVLSVR